MSVADPLEHMRYPLDAQSASDRASCSTLASILCARAQHPDFASKTVYTILNDVGKEEDRLSYASLLGYAGHLAKELASKFGAKSQDRVMIMMPTHAAFPVAFYACLLGNYIAVPVNIPLDERGVEKLLGIRADCEPIVVLGTMLLRPFEDMFENLSIFYVDTWMSKLQLALSTSDLADLVASFNTANPQDLAFLQYSSGTTGNPKGIMVANENLVANHEMIRRRASGGPEIVIASFLPHGHDMGLIGCILFALYCGGHCVIMSPIDFIRRPQLWPLMVTKYKATHTGAPNFAYELIMRKLSDEDFARTDMSSVIQMFSGAEIVRPSTVRAYTEKFSQRGFKNSAWWPCYGLAEGTLMVTALDINLEPRFVKLAEHAELAKRNPWIVAADKEFCALGRPADGVDLKIVNPELGSIRNEYEEGEIWISAPSVCRGYWLKDELSESTFCARIAGDASGRKYLRTGDLGFMVNGELFVTGRIKDICKINGATVFPVDIESYLESQLGTDVRPGCSACFGYQPQNKGEQLVIFMEQGRGVDASRFDEGWFQRLQRLVSVKFQVQLYCAVVLQEKSVFKTSSGKIQRLACRRMFEGGVSNNPSVVAIKTFEIESSLVTPTPSAAVTAQRARSDEGSLISSEDTALTEFGRTMRQSANMAAFRQSLRAWLAVELGVRPADVRDRDNFATYGLNSATAVSTGDRLGTALGLKLSRDVLFQHSTLESLSTFLAGQMKLFGTSGRLSPTQTTVGEEKGDHSSSVPRCLAAAKTEVAVIGMAVRLPGAQNADQFWDVLLHGKETRTKVPCERFLDFDIAEAGKTEFGYFLSDVSSFDHKYWKMTQLEAQFMDPQHRLLLEMVVETLHDARLGAADLKGTQTGVYVGLSGHEYALATSMAGASQSAAAASFVATGASSAMAANRISYLLDLHGPSMAVDTACSASLVALDLAFQDICSGRTDQALVGAANVILTRSLSSSLDKAGFLAPVTDRRCKTFDAAADGYARAEGTCMVLLKRLDDAIRDGDRIYSVVVGTNSNANGKSMSQTAPSTDAQIDLLKKTYTRYDLEPKDVFYVEAHGTGTTIGDPIETKALGAVVGEGANRGDACYVGSAKAIVGHTEAAAGLVGFIKTCLIAHNGCVPPASHVHELNSHIDFSGLQLSVNTAKQPVACPEECLLSVNSLGFGGTNAHAVVRRLSSSEASQLSVIQKASTAPSGNALQPMKWRKKYAQEPVPIPLSAMSWESLASYGASLAEHVKKHNLDLLEVAAALAYEDGHDRRIAPIVSSIEEALAKAQEMAARGLTAAKGASSLSQLAFVFSGQGAAWIGMGKSLYLRSPVFQRAVDEIDSVLSGFQNLNLSISEELLRDVDREDGEKWSTNEEQPLLFAVQWALTRLLASIGIVPSVCIGHSAGELAACAASGILPWDSAARLAALRGSIMHSASGNGGMLAVELPEEKVHEVLGELFVPALTLAAINSPSSTVISGPLSDLAYVEKSLREKKIRVKMVTSEYAFHHSSLNQAAQKLKAAIEETKILDGKCGSASCAFISTSELFCIHPGDVCERVAESSYWCAQMTNSVRFRDAVSNALDLGIDAAIEVGPNPVLLPRLAECADNLRTFSTLRRNGNDRNEILQCAGQVWAAGYAVDWHALYGLSLSRGQISLPPYAWDRVKCWVSTNISVRGCSDVVGNTDVAASSFGNGTEGASSVPMEPADVTSTLRSLFADFMDLAVSSIENEKPLADYGLDSLSKARFRNVVNDVYGVKFPLHVPQELVTISYLANFVNEQMAELQAAAPSEIVSVSAASAAARVSQQAGVIRKSGVRIEEDLSSDIAEWQERMKIIEKYGIENPFYRVQDRVSENTAVINGRRLVNFSCYNYLGLSGSAALNEAAKDAVDRFGTSVSGSRILSGEKTIHQELERELASFLGCEDSLVMLGGHSCNESAIGFIVDGDYDLIIADEAVHNSIVKGMQLSRCSYQMFMHNDMEDLESKLALHRGAYRRCLIIVEGLYSMDADFCNLFQLVRLKKKYKAMLYVDEAHSVGVLGETGRGIGELYPVDRGDVDLWMGTLSKSLGSCGGYLAGKGDLIQYLKYNVPGFIFSAGITPANTAAALAAVLELKRSNHRVRALQFNAQRFANRAKEHNLDVRFRFPSGIVMVMLYDTEKTIAVSAGMYLRGISVLPAVHPAVPEGQARLRFFISAMHTEEQIDSAVDNLAEVVQMVFAASVEQIRASVNASTNKRTSVMLEPGVRRKGWLVKRGHMRKNWLMRWFTLSADYLFYGDSANARPKRSIPLQAIKSVTMLDDAVLGQQNCFMVNGGDFVLYCYADSKRNAQEWVTAIIKAKRDLSLASE